MTTKQEKINYKVLNKLKRRINKANYRRFQWAIKAFNYATLDCGDPKYRIIDKMRNRIDWTQRMRK